MEDVLLTEILCGAALNGQAVRMHVGGVAVDISPTRIVAPTEVVDAGETFVPSIEQAVKREMLTKGSHETAFLVYLAGFMKPKRIVFAAADVSLVDISDLTITPQSLTDAD